MKLNLHYLVVLALTACSGSNIKPLPETIHPSTVVSASPSLRPETSNSSQSPSPVPTATVSPSHSPRPPGDIYDIGRELWDEYWQKKEPELLEVKKRAVSLNKPLEQLNEVKKDQPLYFLLPKFPGVQQLAISVDDSTEIYLFEDRPYKPEEYIIGFYGQYERGVFFLRTDRYDTYLVIKTISDRPEKGSFLFQTSRPELADAEMENFKDTASAYKGRPFFGVVYDDEGEPLAGVLVRVKGRYIPYSAETVSDEKGAYKFENLPYSNWLDYEATKEGYSSRIISESLSDPDISPHRDSNIDFGVPAKITMQKYRHSKALTNKPEIILFEPGFSQGKERFIPGEIDSLSPSFRFQFLKPVQPSSFIDDFQIKAFDLPQRMKISWESASPAQIRWDYIQSILNVPIAATADDFIISWNENFTEVKLKLKPGLALPKPEYPEFGPHFQVDFGRGDKTLLAKDGLSREQTYIKYVEPSVNKYGIYISNYSLTYVGL